MHSNKLPACRASILHRIRMRRGGVGAKGQAGERTIPREPTDGSIILPSQAPRMAAGPGLQTLINYPLQTHTEVGVGVPLGLRVWLSECVSACLSSRHCLQTARMTAGPCVSSYCCFLRFVEESPPPPPLKYVFEVGSGVFQNLVTYPLQTPIEVGVGVPQAACLSSKQPCLRACQANTPCKLFAWPPDHCRAI